MNFKNSSLKTRSATPDPKSEQGLHARMQGHGVCPALFPEAAWKSSNSESATLVKTFRETKKKKALYQGKKCSHLCKPGMLPDGQPSLDFIVPGYEYLC